MEEEQKSPVFLRDKHEDDGLGRAQAGTGRPLTSPEGASEGLQGRRVRLNLFSHCCHECRWRDDGDSVILLRGEKKSPVLLRR